MAGSRFELASSNEAGRMLIAFFGLPNAIDNPWPFIVIKANFFISKGKFMHSQPISSSEQIRSTYCSGSRLVALRLKNRSRRASFFFDDHRA